MSYAYENDAFSRYYDTFVSELPCDALWIDTISQLYREIIARTLINNDHRPVVIELGCGTGKSLMEFDQAFSEQKIRLIGIDHSLSMLDRAKENFEKQSLHSVELFQASLTNFSDQLENQLADCILLPAGTFHHLISDEDRHDFLKEIRRTLRSETGLFAIYLLPDQMIHSELKAEVKKEEKKFQLVAVDNRQTIDQEWISCQTFEFDVPPKIQLSWQLRTCSRSKMIDLFQVDHFQIVFVSIDGKTLLTYEQYCSLPVVDHSTPVVFVVRTIKSTN